MTLIISLRKQLAALDYMGGRKIRRLFLLTAVTPDVGLSVSLLHTYPFLESLARLDNHLMNLRICVRNVLNVLV